MWSASARAHVHTRFPDLANGCTDCVQIWCAASDPLDERLTQVRCGVHLHVRTCTPPSHDGASSPARPSPIKASYWLYICSKLNHFQKRHFVAAENAICLNTHFTLGNLFNQKQPHTIHLDVSPVVRALAGHTPCFVDLFAELPGTASNTGSKQLLWDVNYIYPQRLIIFKSPPGSRSIAGPQLQRVVGSMSHGCW